MSRGKKRERESLKGDMLIQERRMRLAESRRDHVQKSLAFLQTLGQNNILDKKLKAQLEIFVKQNMMLPLAGEPWDFDKKLRRETILLCLHPRLGAASGLQCLSPDLLALIVDQL